MDAGHVQVAHLLRRTTFGPRPGQVAALASGGIDAAIDAALATPDLPLGPEPDLSEWGTPIHWWLARMAHPDSGLPEKMTWFWHGHLTTSQEKVGSWWLTWDQHQLIRQHALGNFRDLLQAITVDAAMLSYLDGDGSRAAEPNENHARELMELFTIGRELVTEEHVRAGAQALAGYRVDWQTGAVSFHEHRANQSVLTFLGSTGVLRASDVVDAACNHPACPPFVAAKLHHFLQGTEPSAGRAAELGAVFADHDLEIAPLVEAIVRHPSFLEDRMSRPRYPVEWVSAAMSALGYDNIGWSNGLGWEMGQVPFHPPGVDGWPRDAWVSAAHALIKAGLAQHAPNLDEVRYSDDPVETVLERCSLYEVSDQTRTALERAASRLTTWWTRGPALLGLAVSSPEFALA